LGGENEGSAIRDNVSENNMILVSDFFYMWFLCLYEQDKMELLKKQAKFILPT
jgi:hypothetical protein